MRLLNKNQTLLFRKWSTLQPTAQAAHTKKRNKITLSNKQQPEKKKKKKRKTSEKKYKKGSRPRRSAADSPLHLEKAVASSNIMSWITRSWLSTLFKDPSNISIAKGCMQFCFLTYQFDISKVIILIISA